MVELTMVLRTCVESRWMITSTVVDGLLCARKQTAARGVEATWAQAVLTTEPFEVVKAKLPADVVTCQVPSGGLMGSMTVTVVPLSQPMSVQACCGVSHDCRDS